MTRTIHDDIRQEVARCAAEKAILRIAPVATRIAADHVDSGVSVNEIASRLLEAGIAAAVPLEIEMPDASPRKTKRRAAN
jgi:hypothetical protein